MNALRSSSVVFTTTNKDGDTLTIRIAASTARRVLPGIGFDVGQTGSFQPMRFLRLNLGVALDDERDHLAHRKLIDLAIDGLEGEALVTLVVLGPVWEPTR